MDKKTIEALKTLVDYTIENESKHYEEASEVERSMHIINYARTVENYLKTINIK